MRRHAPLNHAHPVIALHLGHTDGGRLVRELYGQAAAVLARARTREVFRKTAPVVALPSTAAAVPLSRHQSRLAAKPKVARFVFWSRHSP